VETFVLDLDEKSPKVDELGEFIFRYRDEHCIEVDVPKHIGLNRLFALLDGKGVRVISMRNKANRLEELFVRLIQRKTVEASS
ncbi:MAG: ABC transporter ATP-binding protein, partial [Gammaproteobacteria bacterium]